MKQKEAVILEVESVLGSRFVKYQTDALSVLTKEELEIIKSRITVAIAAGTVDYSKDRSDRNEVRTYARSMVMNHLKKARELNGNSVSSRPGSSEGDRGHSEETKSSLPVKAIKNNKLRGIDLEVLTPELKDYALNKLA